MLRWALSHPLDIPAKIREKTVGRWVPKKMDGCKEQQDLFEVQQPSQTQLNNVEVPRTTAKRKRVEDVGEFLEHHMHASKRLKGVYGIFTDFEKLMLRYEKDERLHLKTRTVMSQLLAYSKRKAEKNVSIKDLELCTLCDRYFHPSRIKRHDTCKKAQKIKATLNQFIRDSSEDDRNKASETNADKAFDFSGDINTGFNGDRVIDLTKIDGVKGKDEEVNLDDFTIEEYFNLNYQQPQSVIEAILTFHAEEKPYKWTLFFEKGIFGTLVQAVGTLYDEVQRGQTNASIFSLGSGRSGSLAITLYALRRVLASIVFLRTHESTQIFSQIRCSDAWLIDDNIEAVRYMCNFDKFILPPPMEFPEAKTNFVLNTHFNDLNPEDGIECFREMAKRRELLSNTGLCIDNLYIPVNKHDHWILVRLDIKNRKYTTIDPRSPTDSSKYNDAKSIADRIWESFGMELPRFSEGVVESVSYLPVQRDVINCGVYVCVYLVLMRLLDAGIPIHHFSKSRSIHEWRFLVLSWILKTKIFIPSNWLENI
jgi:hypothetical protein